MEYSNSSPYEEQLRKHVNKISEGSYDNIKDIIKYPNQISLKILRILIEYACLGQNIAPIELARKKIKEIDSGWLNNFIPQVAQMCICFEDEWEYRRLLELIEEAAPEFIKMGNFSRN